MEEEEEDGRQRDARAYHARVIKFLRYERLEKQSEPITSGYFVARVIYPRGATDIFLLFYPRVCAHGASATIFVSLRGEARSPSRAFRVHFSRVRIYTTPRMASTTRRRELLPRRSGRVRRNTRKTDSRSRDARQGISRITM